MMLNLTASMSANPKIFISAVSKELRAQRDASQRINRLASALAILLIILVGCSTRPSAHTDSAAFERVHAAYARKEYVEAERLALDAAAVAKKNFLSTPVTSSKPLNLPAGAPANTAIT